MTPPDLRTFEERLFEKAWDLAGQKAQFESEMSVYRNFGIECGHWAREETIKEVLGLLRSESADTACGMMELEFKDSGNQHVCSTDWAVWLESKLKEPTVVMKDLMYRIPDDEL